MAQNSLKRKPKGGLSRHISFLEVCIPTDGFVDIFLFNQTVLCCGTQYALWFSAVGYLGIESLKKKLSFEGRPLVDTLLLILF